MSDLETRARIHAALAEPVRLAIMDAVRRSDRTPSSLAADLAVGPSLLAHHLHTLEEVGLVQRVRSSGDGRRRYVRWTGRWLEDPVRPRVRLREPVVFVCQANSARSQLAAALWRKHTGSAARSAGTRPADRVHPGAVAAAARVGLDLSGAVPTHLKPRDLAAWVVTVCDEAYEALPPDRVEIHWSTPDPIIDATPAAFDAALAALDHRIRSVT